MALLACLALAFAAASTMSCSGGNASDDVQAAAATKAVAATLSDGAQIYEDDVTGYIEGYRTSQGLSDDDAWQKSLESSGNDASTMRTMTIYELAAKDVVSEAADEAGIGIAQGEVDDAISNLRTNLGAEDDDVWESYLEMYSTDSDTFSENIRYRLLEQKVFAHYVTRATPASQDILAYIAENYGGEEFKDVRCISTSDASVAYDLCGALSGSAIGEDEFAQRVAQDSDGAITPDPSGELGWDVALTNYAGLVDAVSGLGAGETAKDPYFFTSDELGVLYCAETYTMPSAPETLDEMPSALAAELSSRADDAQWDADCKQWLKERIDSRIEIAEMPGGLSYDVG